MSDLNKTGKRIKRTLNGEVVLQWQYSRNRRRHWVDGEKYGPDFHDLFEIRDNAPYSKKHRFEHGYRLLHKGRNIHNGPWVKALKEWAAYEAGMQHNDQAQRSAPGGTVERKGKDGNSK